MTALLTPRLAPDEPLFIILRRYDGAPRFVAVTYVPDAAKVRQKMLFASTRLSLVRELGSEHFRETIFATSADELTPAGFDKHDAHNALDAPLTEEERSLGEVRRAEQEAGAGTGVREIHLSKNFTMPADEHVLAAFKEFASGEGRNIVLLVSFLSLIPFFLSIPPRSPFPGHVFLLPLYASAVLGCSQLTSTFSLYPCFSVQSENQPRNRDCRARTRQLQPLLHTRAGASHLPHGAEVYLL